MGAHPRHCPVMLAVIRFAVAQVQGMHTHQLEHSPDLQWKADLCLNSLTNTKTFCCRVEDPIIRRNSVDC
jgi:hypothetical protein